MEQALRCVAPTGAVIVIGRDPSAEVSERYEIAVDLAPGRPMHAATWAHLLTRAGGADVTTRRGEGGDVAVIAGSPLPRWAAIAKACRPHTLSNRVR